jgi:hypothetical protein
MITFFTTAKAFREQNAITQRNALACWRALDPDAEVLLIGEEDGAREAAEETGARLIPQVERNAFGTPLIPSLFAIAEREAKHDLLVFSNADILFTRRLPESMRLLAERRRPFLLIGRRRDLGVPRPLDFSAGGGEDALVQAVREKGALGVKAALDYFGFQRGMLMEPRAALRFPPLVIGRPGWDNFTVFWARVQGMDVVNGSDYVPAIHQKHDYRHHAQGKEGVYGGAEARKNFHQTGTERYVFTTLDATYRLDPAGRVRPLIAPIFWRRRAVTLPYILLARWFGYIEAENG